MSKLTHELSDIANAILEAQWKITPFEALQLAAKVQHNRVLTDAFMLDRKVPSALEAIAMELGASLDRSSIKHALSEIAAAMYEANEQRAK